MNLRACAAAACVALLGAQPSSGARAQLDALAARYYAQAGRIASETGRDATMDYYQRLLDDAQMLEQPAPTGLSPESWAALTQSYVRLDSSLADQLLAGTYQPLSSIHGLGESFVRSSKDGTMQPVAVYVPQSYAPSKPAPLVVFLHGRLEAESHLLAPSYITDLAEQTGTIVIAPYGRGFYDFNGTESDVYDALEAATAAFNVDVKKRYLAGYSMGGFSAFKIAPMHPNDWAGVMSIAGALLNSRSQRVLATMPRARFYILTGAHDSIVPTGFAIDTAVFLRDYGVAVTFYSQPDGTHSLFTLRPILEQAWLDMDRAVIHPPASLDGSGSLPEGLPP
ncbi:MAG TPA: alpha/beta hydrolase-fold protein [Candidatus Cybelea sp.]|jgi:predicted esterase|nr:alpha/beta hydrolase-fold protein [Candidatus Cybelea sp.]